MPTQLIIADDHPLFRTALQQTVMRLFPDSTVVEAEDMASLERVTRLHPDADLVLLDLHMPGAHGFSSLVYLRNEHPGTAVIVVSGAEGQAVVRRAMDFGAAGFIPKSAPLDTIGEAIKTVLDGGLWFGDDIEALDSTPDDMELIAKLSTLTAQQQRVLMMIADGLLNKQIAFTLEISEATVKAHVTAILRKLGFYSRTQAAVMVERLQAHPPQVAATGPAAAATTPATPQA